MSCHVMLWDRCLWANTLLFTWALAMRPSSRSSYPPPDLVLWQLISPNIVFFGGFFFFTETGMSWHDVCCVMICYLTLRYSMSCASHDVVIYNTIRHNTIWYNKPHHTTLARHPVMARGRIMKLGQRTHTHTLS